VSRRRLEAPRVALPVDPPHVVRATAQRRLGMVGGLLGLALLLIAGRGALLCTTPGELTVKAGSSQRWDQVTYRARRGDVYDRTGKPLATSVATPNIVVDPSRVASQDLESLAAQVAKLLGRPVDDIRERMKRSGRYVRLAMRVHPSVADQIRSLEHPALWAERDRRRFYPETGLASQLLGFVDGSGTGREGLESSLDRHLRGGSVLVQRRRDRRGLDVDRPTSTKVNEGMDVHLTIDRTIQHVAERALAGVMERSEPVYATAVVVDVKTGDILAMANAPTFNPNEMDTNAAPRRNHAIQDAIEPGSVFKPFTMAAALEEDVVQEHSRMDCEGGVWRVGRTRIHDDHPHKVISMGEVIKYSSNICSAKLALSVGAEPFLGYFGDFGFGDRTGIALPGERKGKVRAAGKIKPIELATTSYGQGITSTPLQLAMATAALANGGVRMKPRLVSQVVDAHGVVEDSERPAALVRVVSKDTADAVTRMMVMVTEPGGTAPRARVPGYTVAGKTGTAEKVVDGKYGSARIGSFMGFLPAYDPEIAIVVVVDEPSKGSRYGGVVAAPAFAEIGVHAMRYLGVPADQPVVGDVVADQVEPDAEENVSRELVASEHGLVMPDLTGVPMRRALATLQGAGLSLTLVGSGEVASHQPVAGALLAAGQPVILNLR
jgi:cell division protein FtsI (penicillin-binding protein 3)